MIIDKNPKAKALIFDLDGTLVDTMPVHYEAWHHVLKSRGFKLSEELFMKFSGIPTFKIVKIFNKLFNINLNPQEVVEEKEAFFKRNIDRIKQIPMIVDIVKKYYGTLPMSVGTGGYRRMAELIINKTKLYHYFDIIVTADDVENHKPEPDTFLKCSHLMCVMPQYCEVFEDADNGLIAADKAGMIASDVRKILNLRNKFKPNNQLKNIYLY